VGVASRAVKRDAVTKAFDNIGVRYDSRRPPTAEEFHTAIEDAHAVSKARGIETPEIDVLEIWGLVLSRWNAEGRIFPTADIDSRDFALEYETLANPVWPMPGAAECLDRLRTVGFVLGIVSNAQFYTRLLFPALLGKTLDGLGFEPDLQVFSFEHGFGKPGRGLCEVASKRLASRGILPNETLFVGNDMLNDVAPAAAVGFRTALFAGDARSLRLRDGDPRVEGVAPDLVLTSWDQLPGCLTTQRNKSQRT